MDKDGGERKGREAEINDGRLRVLMSCADTLSEADDEAPLDLECAEHGGNCCSYML